MWAFFSVLIAKVMMPLLPNQITISPALLCYLCHFLTIADTHILRHTFHTVPKEVICQVFVQCSCYLLIGQVGKPILVLFSTMKWMLYHLETWFKHWFKGNKHSRMRPIVTSGRMHAKYDKYDIKQFGCDNCWLKNKTASNLIIALFCEMFLLCL